MQPNEQAMSIKEETCGCESASAQNISDNGVEMSKIFEGNSKASGCCHHDEGISVPGGMPQGQPGSPIQGGYPPYYQGTPHVFYGNMPQGQPGSPMQGGYPPYYQGSAPGFPGGMPQGQPDSPIQGGYPPYYQGTAPGFSGEMPCSQPDPLMQGGHYYQPGAGPQIISPASSEHSCGQASGDTGHAPAGHGEAGYSPGAGHPKHDAWRYGQLVDVVNGIASGQPDVGKIMGLMEEYDGQFWKGLLVGAAATLILSSDTVKSTLFSAFGSAWGIFQKDKTDGVSQPQAQETKTEKS